MNSLSWFLYAIGLLSNLKLAACVSLGVLTFVYAIWFITYAEGNTPRPHMRFLYGAVAICSTLLIFVPNNNTLYAIAASEAGERLSKTEIVTDATKALHQWIKSQIKENRNGKD